MGVGYVGMALLNYYQNSENELYATTTQASKVDIIKPFTANILLLNGSDSHELQQVIDDCDAMVILIAPNKGQNYADTYLKTAKEISELLKDRTKPFHIVYTSSTSVYEGVQDEWASEELVLSPESDNSKILLETEQVLMDCAETCVLRLGGIYGPNREISKRAVYFSGKTVAGNGNEPTNHIHLNDIVSAIDYCLKHRLSGVYNLVNDSHPTRDELYSGLCHSLGLPLPKWDCVAADSKKQYKVSNHKIIAAGFSFSFQDVIAQSRD